MIQKTIAVIGGGVSSLSVALSLAKKIDFKENMIQLNIYQKKQRLGGRITVEQSPEEEQHHHLFCADVGANYIDYENQEQKKFLQANVPHDLLQNLKPFEGKFMIFQNNKLRQCSPDKVKQRYFYKGGFNKLPQDLRKKVESQHTINFNIKFTQIEKIERQNERWRLKFVGQEQKSDTFDMIVFGTPAPHTKLILEKSDIGKELVEELGRFKYMKQISAVFELESKEIGQESSKPYSILFKNNPISFICFHNQKYPESKKNIAVIQMQQEFTQKWSKKLSPENKQLRISHNQIQKQIGQEIWSLIPEDVRKEGNITKKCLEVYYWPQSLLKPLDSVKDKNQLYNRLNMELNKQFTDQKGNKSLYFTGDYLNNKSRVTGAMAIGIKLGQQIVKQHFYTSLL